jgi:glycosyltransferase involved in cell wall biosynthesis
MRILHYIKQIRLEDGGVVRAVLDMALWQARCGHDVVLATCDDRHIPKDWAAGPPTHPKVVKLKTPGLLAHLDSGFRAEIEPLVKNTDAVHLHVLWDLAQVPIARACKDFNKPYVQSPHGMLADWSVVQKKLKKDVYTALFGRRMIDEASFIVLTAQGELDQSAKRHPKTPGAVIPLVFDIDPYRTCPTPELSRKNMKLPSPELPSILYLSRLHYKKRPDHLLTAARRMRDAGHKFNVIIAGPSDPAYDAKLKAYAREQGVDDITTFTGMVPAEYKPSLFNQSDVFCLPTSMENFGFVYFESLACATAVCTTKGTDTWPEIEGSGGGRIVGMIKSDVTDGNVGGGEVGELADALGDLVSKRERLKPMGHAGREWVMKNMEPRTVTARYIDMYQTAIADLGKRRA